jgi:formylglycine-generating enzyme required for sulfatase activity
MPIAPDTTILGKYKILRFIGEGGMGRVWLAEEITFGNRQVALKEPRSDLSHLDRDDIQRRYQQEISIYAALQKAHAAYIVPVHTVEPYGDTPLLVMAYMAGGDLAQRMAAHPQGLPVDQALTITRALLTALKAAHEHPLEIIHRDLKPANILFDEAGAAWLADFGLAQISGASGRSQLAGGSHPGSPLYMAPEQATSADYLSPAADIFALGCLLFEMLTGKRYKRVRPGTRLNSLRADAPVWIDDVAIRALAEDPWERYTDAGEMLEAMEQEAAERKAAERAKREAAERAKREAEERARQEAAERAKREAAERAKQEAAERAKQEAAERARQEAAERARQEAAEQAKQEAAEQAKQEAAEQAKQEAATIWYPIGIEMVRIPAGEFLYGDNKEKRKLEEFWIARTPVTNEQYKAFVDATKHRAPRHWENRCIPTGKENHPVVRVAWSDATAFCKWAEVRLPSEMEWEKAARGTDGRTWPWGNQEPDAWRCNFNNGVGDTTPVGQYPAGANGLCDMAGNVWEWCAGSGFSRILRGGGYSSNRMDVRCAFRYWFNPDARNDEFGFRVAVSSPQP